MDTEKYNQMVKEMTPKENRLLNMFIAFFVGGVIGVLATFLFLKLNKIYNEELSVAATLLILIALSAFFTTLGIGDTIFTKLKCGIIVPITGFAHSVASSIIDYKKEGFINMGSNVFKLAGSVILYGVVSAILLTLIKVIINV